MQHDFRDIYGSVLVDWFNVEETEIRASLNPDFQYIPVISECSATTPTKNIVPDPIDTRVFPNPFRDLTTIEFVSENEFVRISVFDALGSELQVLMSKTLPAGTHQITFDGNKLPAGSYFYRIQMDGKLTTKRMVKR